MGSEEMIPSLATVEAFSSAMRAKAAAEYVDSAVDPDWKVLSSPEYPGRVDSKEWIEKRKLRHPNILYFVCSPIDSNEVCQLSSHCNPQDCLRNTLTLFPEISKS